jgi:hypothetical protein
MAWDLEQLISPLDGLEKEKHQDEMRWQMEFTEKRPGFLSTEMSNSPKVRSPIHVRQAMRV